MARFRFPGRSSDGASSNDDGSNGDGTVSKIAPKPDDSPKKPRRPRLRKLRMALVFFGLAILAFISWIFGIMMAVASDLPQLEDRAQFANAQNSVVYDINGNKIATLTNNEGRILVPSVDIAPVMKEATVAIEDQRFYQHRGVDFLGIGRAVVQDVLQTGAAQGASTITEQFVKNALRAQDSRTIFEKLREAALAYQLERHWDKDKILTEYLNEIYFGNGAYGIEEAAKTYFGYNHPGCGGRPDRCAGDLLPWEAALLAGMISSPSGYDPVTNPQEAMARRNQVLQNMVSQGDITQEEYNQLLQGADPQAQPDPDADGELQGALLHQLAAPAAGRQVRIGRGLRRRSARVLDARPPVPAEGPADRVRPHRRRRPQLRRGRARQPDGRSPRDGRRDRLLEDPIQPRHAGTAPARVGLQAVHPRDGTRAGPLAR